MSLKKTTSVSNSSCILNQIDPKESKKQIFDIKNKKNNPTEMIKNNLSKGLFEDSHIRNVSEEQSKQRSEAKSNDNF